MPWWAWVLLGVYIAGAVFTFHQIVVCNLYSWGNYMFESVLAALVFCWLWPISLPVVYFSMHPTKLGSRELAMKYVFREPSNLAKRHTRY